MKYKALLSALIGVSLLGSLNLPAQADASFSASAEVLMRYNSNSIPSGLVFSLDNITLDASTNTNILGPGGGSASASALTQASTDGTQSVVTQNLNLGTLSLFGLYALDTTNGLATPGQTATGSASSTSSTLRITNTNDGSAVIPAGFFQFDDFLALNTSTTLPGESASASASWVLFVNGSSANSSDLTGGITIPTDGVLSIYLMANVSGSASSPTAVPEPSQAMLFLSGSLVGLTFLVRRRKA